MLPPEIANSVGHPDRPFAPTSLSNSTWTDPQNGTAIDGLDSSDGTPSAEAFVGMTLAEMERELIEATIEHCGGSVPKAAHILDVSASTIYRKREAWAAHIKAS